MPIQYLFSDKKENFSEGSTGFGIIAANDITQDCTDYHQLQSQVEKTEETVGELPDDAKQGFDDGYFSGANLRYLEV